MRDPLGDQIPGLSAPAGQPPPPAPPTSTATAVTAGLVGTVVLLSALSWATSKGLDHVWDHHVVKKKKSRS